MSNALRMMRLSIIAALGLSASHSFAQEPQALGTVPVCENPKTIFGELVGGSGYVRCEDGRVLREEAVWDLPGNAGTACWSEPHTFEFEACRKDSECTDRPYGACIVDWETARGGACVCEYRCMSDLDCRVGQVCLANGIDGSQKKCVDAKNCRTNADCASGQCEVSRDNSRSLGGGITLGCRSERDECHYDWHCADRGCGLCVFNPFAARWTCAEECFQLGRPFLIQGEAILPTLKQGHAWIEDSSYTPSTLDPALAECATQHWLECARMEHASVAAFARFALQLMHLGAPPELLESTTQAMHDEIAHAKACFALANRYCGQARSAGTLEVSQALEHELAPARIAVDVFLEGCVGESVAALEASEMSRLCTDPQVARVLEKIAKDEHQHALLAWRSLAWMLDSLVPAQRAEVAASLGQLMAGLREEVTAPAPVRLDAVDELERNGVPSSQRKEALRRQAIAQLVLPCASALLELQPNEPRTPVQSTRGGQPRAFAPMDLSS